MAPRWRRWRWLGGTAALATAFVVAPASAAVPAPPPPVEDVDTNEAAGYSPPEAAAAPSPLTVSGYVDVGFAKAQGNGTSFAPGDTRLPADYGVDTFAPAVNSRGDVASIDSDGRFTNGFLPRTVAIGGRPSFLMNTINVDLRYQPAASPFMVFTRVQALPRHFVGSGNDTRLYVEQAFGRFMPFSSRELHLSVGKVDSVFGIEYLETQANVRVGITPSPMARYTTGTSVGAKLFMRQQLAPLWSAVSLNVAATNSAPFVEALQPPDASLSGQPVVSGRLGYDLNLPGVQVRLGGSGVYGPRNDQRDPSVKQRMWGVDARINVAGLSLSGEYIDIHQDAGTEAKETGVGLFPLASGFVARGYYVFAGYTLSPGWRLLARVTLYGRYGRRDATFEGFRGVQVASITGGFRLDLGETVILKGELLVNRELEGAPVVDNDVYTSSLVWSW